MVIIGELPPPLPCPFKGPTDTGPLDRFKVSWEIRMIPGYPAYCNRKFKTIEEMKHFLEQNRHNQTIKITRIQGLEDDIPF